MVPVIEVADLCKQYDNIKAVDDLSFTVNAGDIYGFLGQNGAGKSTTIRMLLTLVKPSSGHINIFGKPLGHSRTEILKNIGAVIEKPDLYKYLTAYENLSIFARLSGIRVSRSIIMRQLALVGLENRAGSKVKTFSQGMKQRLGIAVALIHNPRLIILDEPVNGLDPQGIADVRKLILQLSREEGKTILMSSHLLSEIEQVANKMLIIHRGKKIVEGNVGELLDPSKSMVRLGTDNNKVARKKIAATGWGILLDSQAEDICLSMPRKDVPILLSDIIAMGIQVYSVNTRNALEDYFLSLTNTIADVDITANRTI